MSNKGNEDTKWREDRSIFPPAKDIAEALQDLGKKKNAKKKNGEFQQIHFCPLLDKLALKLCNNITKTFNFPCGLTKNTTRGRLPLCKLLVIKRRAVDATECDPFFRQCVNDEKVFLFANDPATCGLEIVIDSFQEATRLQLLKKQDNRTNNDGLGLSCILLDPEHRGSVSGMVSKKKNRTKADVPGDPALHFFEKILSDCFANEAHQVPHPPSHHCDEFPEELKGSWDPNAPSIFENERDGAWLEAAWDDCVKPKHKKALDKWNEDTGGGDGSPTEFHKFCGADAWLVWVFCKDLDANFLLAQSAAGRMPRHLQIEGGFQEDVSSLGEDGGSGSGKRHKLMEEEFDEAKKQRHQMRSALTELTGILKRKKDDETVTGDEDPADKSPEQVTKHSRWLTDEKLLDSVSPATKEACTATVRRKRKEALKRLNDEDEEEEGGDV